MKKRTSKKICDRCRYYLEKEAVGPTGKPLSREGICIRYPKVEHKPAFMSCGEFRKARRKHGRA